MIDGNKLGPNHANGLDPAQRIHQALSAGARLRERYRTGVVYGAFVIELPTAGALRSLAFAGYDFVVLDLEHSSYDVERLAQLATEAQLLGIPALARVWAHDAGLIGKVLDAGANGIMAAHVETPQQAAAIVSAARYAPVGDRGLAPLVSYAAAPVSQARLGDDVLVLLQIEGAEGLANCADIAAVPGADGVFVGVYDLSQSLGRPGDVEAYEVIEAAEQVARDAKHVMLGIYVDDPARSAAWTKRGFRLQCISFDARLLMDGARAAMSLAKGGAS